MDCKGIGCPFDDGDTCLHGYSCVLLSKNNNFPDIKDAFDKCRADERRKFAEILKSKPYFDEVHNMESIPISFIDEVLAEYEKEVVQNE